MSSYYRRSRCGITEELIQGRRMKENPKCRCPGGHSGRRDFLRVGALTSLGISLSQFLRLQEATAAGPRKKSKAEACILLWLDGGPSQMDTWDPKSNSAFKPISTNVPGIQISELLPRMARQMDKVSIIRSMHTEENDHLQGTLYAATGHGPNPAMKFPAFNAIITKELGARNHVPPNVMIPGMPKGKIYEDAFRGHIISTRYDPVMVPDVNAGSDDSIPRYEMADLSLPKSFSRERIEDRRSFLNLVDRFYRQKMEIADFSDMDTYTQQAWNMILSSAVQEAFDLSRESEKTKDAYGRDRFGQSVLMARRLIEAGSRFATAAGYKSQAWDTHADNDKKHRDSLTPSLDQTLSTLLEDLEQRGLLESTVVVALGEFGRTPDINFDGGRDHWPECWSVALAGGGIRGGQIVGASDERGAYVAERRVTMGDLHATIYKALGIDWRKEYMHPVGRPVKIANSIDDLTGTPVHELI